MNRKDAHDAVRVLLRYIGEDPDREGLVDTPARVCRALIEMTEGYGQMPGEILQRQFASRHDQMVMLRDVEFWSLCEHHLLPFSGTATLAYIPKGDKVVGLSKLARLVHCHARRLQIQERMTSDICSDLHEHLDSIGTGVIVRATHLCMACRGVRSPGVMVTSQLLGALLDDAAARAEFMGLAG